MAYGVIVYESEHESLLSLPPEDVGNIIQNMIRTFKGEEVELLANKCVNAYSMSLCNRVNADKGKVVEKVVAGTKGGAPIGNNNASKTSKTTTQNKQNNQTKQAKQQVIIIITITIIIIISVSNQTHLLPAAQVPIMTLKSLRRHLLRTERVFYQRII